MPTPSTDPASTAAPCTPHGRPSRAFRFRPTPNPQLHRTARHEAPEAVCAAPARGNVEGNGERRTSTAKGGSAKSLCHEGHTPPAQPPSRIQGPVPVRFPGKITKPFNSQNSATCLIGSARTRSRSVPERDWIALSTPGRYRD